MVGCRGPCAQMVCVLRHFSTELLHVSRSAIELNYFEIRGNLGHSYGENKLQKDASQQARTVDVCENGKKFKFREAAIFSH